MKLIDRYIIKELLGPFFFAVAAFVGVFIGTGPFYRIAEMMTKYKAPWYLAAQLIACSLPVAIYPMLPMALLLATLLTFGKMSSSSEITAMKSGGVSFARLVLPVALLSLVISLISFLTAQFIMPITNEKFDNIVKYEVQKVTTPRGYQENLIIRGGFGTIGDGYTVLYAREYDPATQRLNQIAVADFDENKKVSKLITAEWAEFHDFKWTMHNGAGYEFDIDKKLERKLDYKEQILPLERPPEKSQPDKKNPDQMTIGELRQVIMLHQREGKTDFKKYETEMFSRAAIPFSCFVFALIGAPLGMQSNRSSSSVGLGLSLVIILVYYALYASMTAMATNNIIPAILAAWTPNIIGFVVGSALVVRASRK
ncbi:MAG: LptF/LptG family permease [Negativicutes bacterium]|jgi:lipopolysaccharide export system permease protein